MHWFWRAIIAIRKATKAFLLLLPLAIAFCWPLTYVININLFLCNTFNLKEPLEERASPSELTGDELRFSSDFARGRLWIERWKIIPGASSQRRTIGPRLVRSACV